MACGVWELQGDALSIGYACIHRITLTTRKTMHTLQYHVEDLLRRAAGKDGNRNDLLRILTLDSRSVDAMRNMPTAVGTRNAPDNHESVGGTPTLAAQASGVEGQRADVVHR